MIEGVTLKLLIQVTVDAHVHLRSQVDGIHLVGQQVLDLIHDLLYLRVGPGTIDKGAGWLSLIFLLSFLL